MFTKLNSVIVPNSSYCVFTINSYVDCDFDNKQANQIKILVLYPFRNLTIPDLLFLLKEINGFFPLSEVIKYNFIFSSDREVSADYVYRYE